MSSGGPSIFWRPIWVQERRQYDSEDGTMSCASRVYARVKNSTVTRVLRSVSKKGARHKEPEVVDLDDIAEESVSEQVARLITHQAGAGG